MNKIIVYFSTGASLLSIVLMICIVTGKIGQPKIAYVRSAELVYGYFGMQDAHREYEEKSNTWKNNTDTLQQKFQHDLDAYKLKGATLSKTEKEKIEQSLSQQKQTIINYMQNVSEQAKKEDEKITQAVLNQVNSFVEEYGKTHGYKLILGTTQSGSLLYGEEGIDLTKEILEALNKNYKGEELHTN